MLDIQLYSSLNSNSNRAVIVLPEIFGLSEEIQKTVDRFASDFGLMAFGLDYYQNTEFAGRVFDPLTEVELAKKAKLTVDGDAFLQLLEQAITRIQTQYPNIQDFVVCGFCFGGRLALLSGVNSKVSQVIDFYGAGTTDLFVNSKTKSILNYLASADANSELKVLAIFGGQDSSITTENRVEIKTVLDSSRIEYQEVVFLEAGHGFFNQRQSYNPTFATKAWEKIGEFLNIKSTMVGNAEIVPGQSYRHYKGGKYRVLSLAKDESNLKEMVVYQSTGDSSKIWIRPLEDFVGSVKQDNQNVARFELITLEPAVLGDVKSILSSGELLQVYNSLPKTYQRIISRMIIKMYSQHLMGVDKYGVSIDENTNTDPIYWQEHMVGEVANALVYLQKILEVASNAE